MTGGPWTRSMKVVHGPGPKWGSMDPWSMFCPHPLVVSYRMMKTIRISEILLELKSQIKVNHLDYGSSIMGLFVRQIYRCLLLAAVKTALNSDLASAQYNSLFFCLELTSVSYKS